MFSCCALFAHTDDPADVEHLKGLDEVDAPVENDISITVDGMSGSSEFGGTPLVSSPRALAAQRGVDEIVSAARFSQNDAVQPNKNVGRSEAESVAIEATRVAEEEATAAEAARAAAQKEAETASAERAEQTMRVLREAEDAAHAAAAEAEKRRFEEEASARAARKAESEARKAMWRAEEAQRMKEQTGSKASDEAAAILRIAQEEAELARRQATAARMEKAKDCLTSRLLSDEGLRVQKHGRNGKSAYRTLECPDDTCNTLTWGKKVHDLRSMQEVRKGTEADPAYPGETGTTILRRSKTASLAMERSFSLLFPSRSLDFTAASMDECEQLVLGFRALLTSQRRGSDSL